MHQITLWANNCTCSHLWITLSYIFLILYQNTWVWLSRQWNIYLSEFHSRSCFLFQNLKYKSGLIGSVSPPSPSFPASLLLSFQQRLFLAKSLQGSMIPPEKRNRPRYKSFYSSLGVTFKEKQIPYQPESEWRPRTANIFGKPKPNRNMVPNHLADRPSVENESELEFCYLQTHC